VTTETRFSGADRRAFVATLAAGMLTIQGVASAQTAAPAARLWRIGFLTPSAVGPRGVMPEMRQRLRELGYIEGRDVLF